MSSSRKTSFSGRHFSGARVSLVASLALGFASTAFSGLGCDSPPPATPAEIAARGAEPRAGSPTAAAPIDAPPGARAPASSPTPSTPAPAPPPVPASTSLTAGDPAIAAGGAKPEADLGTPAQPPKKISARHVLVQWMGSERASTQILRSREQAMAIAQQVLRRAKSGEDLGRLAMEYSDEPGASSRGGSLGRFGRGQMVPAFEAAAFQLKVGQISDIVETPFGFHIIQRTE